LIDVIEINGQEIPATILYSEKRRTLGITIKPNGDVVIHAPSRYSREQILSFTTEKAEWILKHRNNFLSRQQVIRAYTTGEEIPFYDRNLLIQREAGSSFRARMEDNFLILSVPGGFNEEDIVKGCRDAVIYLYRRAGLGILSPLVDEYSKKLGISPPDIRIRVQDKKWGCCTPTHGLIFNVKILLAPPIIVKYLVVHEVCHIPHRNHQSGFWKAVQQLMPEYEEAETLLKTDGWKWIF